MMKPTILLTALPAMALPLGTLLTSIVALSAPESPVLPLPDHMVDEEALAEADLTEEEARRIYVALPQSVDVTLPGAFGRLRLDIAIVIRAGDAFALRSAIGDDMTEAQGRAGEAVLQLAEARFADGALDSYLVEFRRDLPPVLQEALNTRLAELDLPQAVLEVLIIQWAHVPGPAAGAAQTQSL